jgi:hypothetical protein
MKSSVCAASSAAFHSGTAFFIRSAISFSRSGVQPVATWPVTRAKVVRPSSSASSREIRSPWPGASMASVA